MSVSRTGNFSPSKRSCALHLVSQSEEEEGYREVGDHPVRRGKVESRRENEGEDGWLREKTERRGAARKQIRLAQCFDVRTTFRISHSLLPQKETDQKAKRTSEHELHRLLLEHLEEALVLLRPLNVREIVF